MRQPPVDAAANRHTIVLVPTVMPASLPCPSFGSASFDCLALPPDHPQPLRRLSLRDISITVTLAGTWVVVVKLGWEHV